MSISRDDVLKVSLLARLDLSDVELEEYSAQLSQIVAYVDQLSQLDTEGIEPLSHPVDAIQVMASDEFAPSFSRKDALANAPRHDGEFFLVPAVF